MAKKLTTEEFIIRAINVHGDKYGYSNTVYTKSSEKVSIKCSLHGVFEVTANNHLSKGVGCKECYIESSRLTQEEFIQKSNLVHNNKYDYPNTVYTKSSENVSIKCHIHGVFEQRASEHLKGSGCFKCNKNGITKERFISIGKDKKCTFYIIKCHSNNEEFYKIGITSQKLKNRLSGKSRIPYDYTILKEYKSSASEVWDIENHLKENLKSVYTPCIHFDGSVGECFTNLKEIENNLINML